MKTDTDGYDLAILESYVATFSAKSINVFFEMEVKSDDDVRQGLECMRRFMASRYVKLLLWDDPGHFMCSITSMDLLEQLLRWQQSWVRGSVKEPRIWNFDVLALHENDAELEGEIVAASQRISRDG